MGNNVIQSYNLLDRLITFSGEWKDGELFIINLSEEGIIMSHSELPPESPFMINQNFAAGGAIIQHKTMNPNITSNFTLTFVKGQSILLLDRLKLAFKKQNEIGYNNTNFVIVDKTQDPKSKISFNAVSINNNSFTGYGADDGSSPNQVTVTFNLANSFKKLLG